MSFGTLPPRNDYLGDGTTAVYGYGFKINDPTVLRVTQATPDGVQTPLTYLVDFTVDGVGNTNGGNITLTAGNLAAGTMLTIRFDGAVQQPTDLRNQGAFFLEVVEDMLDLITRFVQALGDKLGRSVHLPETEAGTDLSTTLPAASVRAGKTLAFDSSGNAVAVTPTSGAFNNPLTTKGDVLISSGGPTPDRLPIGGNGTILEADSTQPKGMKWGHNINTVIASLLPYSLVTAAGDLLVATGNALVARLARGLVGQILMTDPLGAVPNLKWANPLCFNGATGLSVIPFNIVQGTWANGSTTYAAVASGNYNLLNGTAGDGFLISDPGQFFGVDLNLTVAGNPTTVVYEYWNGTVWTATTVTLLGIATFNGVGYLQIALTGTLTGWVVGGTGTNVPAGNFNLRVRQTVGTATVTGRAWASHRIAISTLEVIAANVTWSKIIGQAIGVMTPALTIAGLNGLSTGALAASTAYYGYLIYNPTTLVWGALLDVAYPIPSALPSGFTFYAAVTAFRTDANKNIIPYTQQARTCVLRWAVIDLASATQDGKTSLTVTIPDNATAWIGELAATSAGVAALSDMPFFTTVESGLGALQQAQADGSGNASTAFAVQATRILLTTARTIYAFCSSAGKVNTRGYELPGALL
jgi:hypothetical protein